MAEYRWDDLLTDPRFERFFEQMTEEYERAKESDALLPLSPFLC
jgi:hypothetical protein